jgi:3-hydroxyisobutyrate dehydrogenase
MTAIGFIGLGSMGAPMAANLIRAGHEVTGFDIAASPVAALAAIGGRAANTTAEAAAAGEVVITMLPAGPQVREVYLGNSGVLGRARNGALLIDCSTIDVETARDVAEAAAEAAMLDAPVSGGTAGAAAATSTIMVGGAAAAFARGQPVLAAMGRSIVHAGPSGNGQAAKICNNMILGVCEAFALADRLGLAGQTLFDIAAKSSGQCWALTSYCPVPGPVPASPANRGYAPGFTAAMMLRICASPSRPQRRPRRRRRSARRRRASTSCISITAAALSTFRQSIDLSPNRRVKFETKYLQTKC